MDLAVSPPSPAYQLGIVLAKLSATIPSAASLASPAGSRRLLQNASDAFVLLAVGNGSRQPVCGNGFCEIGERLAQLPGISLPPSCISDCPLPYLQCPTVLGDNAFCSGRGTCLTATGACMCYEVGGGAR